MPVLKAETDNITSIAASLIGIYVILVIIYVEPYKWTLLLLLVTL